MNKVLWKGNNISSSYTFSNPNRMGYWTKAFMKYVKSADKYNIKATKKGFYKMMGKKLVKGNMCTFFASITQAGIVILNQDLIWEHKVNQLKTEISRIVAHFDFYIPLLCNTRILDYLSINNYSRQFEKLSRLY